MSQIEARVEKLETEVFALRQLVHKKDEIKHQVWNEMQEGIHALCQKNHDGLTGLRDEVQLRFNQVNHRFEQVDKRFEQLEENMNQRFEHMEEKINQRFEHMEEKINQRFERLEHLMEKALMR
ncbi:hypothetical protein [Endozoicomonas sp. Mp262]|uniref:hypothetical protein n=1 Tax=Endozoicomonas sp. Mp262 TaxID=2919499 RepID=UPI0021D89DF2